MLERNRITRWVISGVRAAAILVVADASSALADSSRLTIGKGGPQAAAKTPEAPPPVKASSQPTEIERSTRGLASISLTATTRIIGGQDAAQGSWPWQVALKKRSATDGKFNFICGGSVVGEHWVLTAGHCVTDSDGKALSPDSFLLVGGTHDLKSEGAGEQLHVKRVVPHDAYSAKTLQNDIALLEIVESARAAPVPFADAKNAALEQPGQLGTVTGWGLVRAIHYENNPNGGVVAMDAETRKPITPSQMESEYLTSTLKQLTMPLVALDQCSAQYKPKNYGVTIDNRVLCAGLAGEKKDACHGDSGGPLVVADQSGYVQVGVVSLGDPDCVAEGLPGIYTKVSAFEPWLRRMTGINQDAPASPAETQAVTDNSLGGENPAGLEVRIIQGETVKVGQNVQFRVTAQQPGYLVLFDVGPDGRIIQIFPNAYSLRGPLAQRFASNRLDAPKPLVVPDVSNPYSGFDFAIFPPTGAGKILAVLSDKPIQELQIEAPQQNSEGTQRALKRYESRTQTISLLGALSAAIKRDLAASTGSTPHFSVAITSYQVEQ